MKNALVRFFREEEGLATIEIVLIICILAALAFIFKNAIKNFFTQIQTAITNQINKITTDDSNTPTPKK